MVLEMKNISKSFGEIPVLHNINLHLAEGEVLGLIGPNGSGKSTLMNILSGVYQQDRGRILVDGKELDNSSPAAALKQGVFMLYQQPALVENMSVMENIFLGKYEHKFGFILDTEKMNRKTKELLKIGGCGFKSGTIVRYLSFSEKCMVTVLRAYLVSAKIMIIDETTAGFRREEQNSVFELVRKAKSMGIGVIFITHRMEELSEICDRICVIRDGRMIANLDVEKISSQIIWEFMSIPKPGAVCGQERGQKMTAVLQVTNLRKDHVFDAVNFTLHRGEILGIDGLVGSGRSDLLKTIFGENKIFEGELYLDGKPFRPKDIFEACTLGIAYMSEDRLVSGIIENMSVVENVNLSRDARKHGFFLLDQKKDIESYVDDVIRPGYSLTDPTRKIRYISGGEQQKISLLRTIFSNSRILLLDEPTKGIDVATKAEICDLIRRKAREGVSFIVCSSDQKELDYLCDRVIVLHHGNFTENVRAGG